MMGRKSYAPRALLVHGVAAAKAGEHQEAIRYLERYLSFDPPQEEKVDAYYYLSIAVEDPKEKRQHLESALAIDPVDGRARRALAILDGKLEADEIVNPDKMPAPESDKTAAAGDRFTCPSCGGRMSFTPDGQSLTCDYCEAKSGQNKEKGSFEDDDFFLALATAKGHSAAQQTKVVVCEGCGVEFMASPKTLTWTCPYCESSYVEAKVKDSDLVQPTAIIPFAVSKEVVAERFKLWRREQNLVNEGRVTMVHGIYLPMWTFDIGGFVNWSISLYESRTWLWVTEKDEKTVHYDDLRVPATREFPELLPSLFDSYDYAGLVPYQGDYLVSWMAESYDIVAGDAALRAREMALAQEHKIVQATQLRRNKDLRLFSSRMTVEQYKLVLLPVWVIHYELEDTKIVLLVNGQNAQFIYDKKLLRKGKNKDGGFLSRWF